MIENIEFCIHWECTNRKCERHPSQIKAWWFEFEHSFMDLKDSEFCKKQKQKGGAEE